MATNLHLKSPDHPASVPHHPKTQTHTHTHPNDSSPRNTNPQAAGSTTQSPAHATQYSEPLHVIDGRRNSVGEAVPCETDNWRPNLDRKQSWNQQDLKRKMLESELGQKKEEGQGTGFTEGGQGTRRI